MKQILTAKEWQSLVAKHSGTTTRKKPADEEHRLQVQCVEWFFKLSPYRNLPLFAVPNGGRRDAVTGAKMKAEGVVAGVADLILLVPSRSLEYHSLCIEIKTLKGRQSDSQKEWQKKAEANGSKYVVCRSFEQFKQIIKEYLYDD